eukprot:TRINITY_DN8363_c0_g3_i3.p1 TRINITY_DN8363_c0_g3~~TRINITY_DN8363_c0_g3_i3.p1  ORF type:complete len:201 (+),score=49.20 TRINITY_DN8363_c0_g3_i3:468-1070(+)
MLQGLLDSDWVRDFFFSPYFEGRSVLPYGVLIFSKFPFMELTQYSLPSNLERKMLSGFFFIHGKWVLFSTFHLESGYGNLESKEKRRSQLKRAHVFLEENVNKSDLSIILGDFNCFSISERKQQLKQLEGYRDIWEICGGNGNGATCCGDRIDLILAKYGDGIEPKEISIFGSEEICPNLYPSDHHALVARFSLESSITV